MGRNIKHKEGLTSITISTNKRIKDKVDTYCLSNDVKASELISRILDRVPLDLANDTIYNNTKIIRFSNEHKEQLDNIRTKKGITFIELLDEMIEGYICRN